MSKSKPSRKHFVGHPVGKVVISPKLEQFFRSRKSTSGNSVSGISTKHIARKLFNNEKPHSNFISGYEVQNTSALLSDTNTNINAEIKLNEDEAITFVKPPAAKINLCKDEGLSPAKLSKYDGNVFPVSTQIANFESKNDKISTPCTSSIQMKLNEVTTPVRSPTTQTKLRKELDLGEYKKIVRQSRLFSALKRHVSEFEENVSSLNETKKNLNDLYSSPKLKKFNIIEVEVISPVKHNNVLRSPIRRSSLKPRRLFSSNLTESPIKEKCPYVSPSKILSEGPVKSPIKPAFEKYNYLLASKEDPLILPRKYLILKELFRHLDMIIKLRVDRGELVTFRKIQPEVQRITRKNFTEDHLGKIKTVYPEAYELSRERIKVSMTCDESYELIIKTLESNSDVTDRFNTFSRLLLQRAKFHHQEFLKTLNPPLDIPIDQIKRWHPEFDVDNMPDIECFHIPQPLVKNDVLTSAKDVLEKTHQMISSNIQKECRTPIERGKKSEQDTEKFSKSVVATTRDVAAFEKALKEVPKSILEKIRAKQAAKIAQNMMQNQAEVIEAAMLSRLPELVEILRIVFVKEKKDILAEELVIQRVSQSYKEKMPKSDLIQHFKLISKHVPGWMNFCIVRKTPYIRLTRHADITLVTGKLRKLAQYN